MLKTLLYLNPTFFFSGRHCSIFSGKWTAAVYQNWCPVVDERTHRGFKYWNSGFLHFNLCVESICFFFTLFGCREHWRHEKDNVDIVLFMLTWFLVFCRCVFVLDWIWYACSIELCFAFLLVNGVWRFFTFRLVDALWVLFGLLVQGFCIV